MGLTNEMFETRMPNGNEEYFNKLNENQKENYLKLYQCYSNFLYQYMMKKLELKKYDDMILESDNNFKSVSVENMDLYQYLGNKYLKYFYIRNNLYIERLNNDEKNYLQMKMNMNPDGYDERVETFIEKTYSKVCVENTDLTSKVNINYGPDAYSFFKPDNAFIIGYRFDDYYKDDNTTDEEWVEQNNDRLFELELTEMGLNRVFKDKLLIPVCVQKYNDFSVNYIFDKKKQNEKRK